MKIKSSTVNPPISTSSHLSRWSVNALAYAAPAILIIATCCLTPLLWILSAIGSHRLFISDLSLSAFRASLLFRTLTYNGFAAILATFLGLPMGLVLGRGRGWIPRLLWLIVPAAIFMPSLAFAYGWSQLLRLAGPLYHPLGLSFIPGGVPDVMRCIWTLAAWLWAVPACLIGLSLRRMDTSVQQQAMLDGALLRVTIRQLSGPVLASLAAVTVLATQEFAVYEPTGISVVATEVRMVFDTGAFSSASNPISAGGLPSGTDAPDQYRRAAAAVATAIPLLAITALLAILGAWGAGQLSAADEIAIGDWPKILDSPQWVTRLAVGLLLLNIGVPIAALVASLRVKLLPIKIWEEFAPVVGGSLGVGAVTAVIALIVAVSVSTRWTRGLMAIAGLSFLIGGQLLAIALIRWCNRPGMDWAYNAMPLPVAAYIGRFGWIALAAGRATWSRPFHDLRQMAALEGAGIGRIAVSIVWPLAWPVLLAGSLLVGALSLTEVPATVLLSPQNPQVLTPLVMTWVHTARFDPMIEASLLMMLMVLIPVSLAIPLIGFFRRQ